MKKAWKSMDFISIQHLWKRKKNTKTSNEM